jgi:hypothetical protein
MCNFFTEEHGEIHKPASPQVNHSTHAKPDSMEVRSANNKSSI